MGEYCSVNIFGPITSKAVHCKGGSNLYRVLSQNGFDFIAPCAGKRLCGKCAVKIISGKTSDITDVERSFLSPRQLEEGWRLSCCVEVISDITVELIDPGKTAILTAGNYIPQIEEPLIKKIHITVPPATLNQQKDLLTRFFKALNVGNRDISLEQIRRLSQLTKESDRLTVVLDKEDIISVEDGNSPLRSFGIAIDIGTTTIAAYLLDLEQGTVLSTQGVKNLQSRFGSDVISRISYTAEHSDGPEALNSTIINQIDGIILSLARQNNIKPSEIYGICFAGNTTMLHFALGLNAQSIASAPFSPVSTSYFAAMAKQLGLKNAPNAKCYFLPCVSAYIGADIVAAVLSSGMHEKDELCLLVDIGTNGEIVLGNKDIMVACSAAAGPAFEGAKIKDGTGGVAGAIDSFELENGNARYTTIDGAPPIGICGSGVIDIVAAMRKNGLIDETGRMIRGSEITIAKGQDKDIAFTARDVREVQLAKAAIAAGIKVMLKRMKKSENDISQVFLAGAFGSYMNKNSAAEIGLLSKSYINKITNIGNAAGAGAVMSLLSKEHMSKCLELAQKIQYVELSGSADFSKEFTDNMTF